MKIDLQYPITTIKDGKEYNIVSVEIGRLKAKHLKFLPKDADDIHSYIPLIANIANMEEGEAEELDVVDLTTIAQELTQYLGKKKPRRRGRKPSGA